MYDVTMLKIKQNNNGFTLIEMSIVLVIIGLIVSGIVVGKDLIRATEIQSVITDFNKYSIAIEQFDDQYQSLPGDMPDATTYWPGIGGGGNGNGDRMVNSMHEQVRFWQQLSLSKIIPGLYDGTSTSSSLIPGVNVPKARMKGANFSVYYYGDGSGRTHDVGGNYIRLGGSTVTPAESLKIDKALDNGVPISGKIIGANRGGGLCCVDNCNRSTYNLSEKRKSCQPFLRFGE